MSVPRGLRSALAATVVLALGGEPGAAADERVVLCTGDWPPYTGASLDGGGLVTKLVRRGYAAVGDGAEITFRPWKRCARGVRNDRFDATFPYIMTKRREERFAFSDPLLRRPIVPLVPRDAAGTIQSTDDLRGRTVCQPEGWAFAVAALNTMIDTGAVTRRRPKTFEQCITLISRGRADFIVGQPKRMEYVAAQVLDDPSRVHVGTHVLGHTTFHIMLNPDSEGFDRRRRRANEAIDAARRTTLYQSAFESTTR